MFFQIENHLTMKNCKHHNELSLVWYGLFIGLDNFANDCVVSYIKVRFRCFQHQKSRDSICEHQHFCDMGQKSWLLTLNVCQRYLIYTNTTIIAALMILFSTTHYSNLINSFPRISKAICKTVQQLTCKFLYMTYYECSLPHYAAQDHSLYFCWLSEGFLSFSQLQFHCRELNVYNYHGLVCRHCLL